MKRILSGMQPTNKLQLGNYLGAWGKMTGIIDTPEKFAAHRLQMAESEWARMKGNDSRECRNCHSFDAMDVEKQKLGGSKMHKIGVAERRPASTATRVSPIPSPRA